MEDVELYMCHLSVIVLWISFIPPFSFPRFSAPGLAVRSTASRPFLRTLTHPLRLHTSSYRRRAADLNSTTEEKEKAVHDELNATNRPFHSLD